MSKCSYGVTWNNFCLTSETVLALNSQGSQVKQTSENVCLSHMSATSVFVHYASGYYPNGISRNVLGLLFRVICCPDIAKWVQYFLHYGVMVIHC